VTKLIEYFHTDWAAMTANDWQGVIFTVLAVVAMVAVYVMVFNPKTRKHSIRRAIWPCETRAISIN